MTGPRVTADDLAGLRRKAEAATPGPWACSHFDELSMLGAMEYPSTTLAGFYGPNGDADTEFIAAANPATVLALLDEINQLQRERVAAEVRACDMQAAAEEAHAEIAAAQTHLAKVRAVRQSYMDGAMPNMREFIRGLDAALAEGPAPETTP